MKAGENDRDIQSNDLCLACSITSFDSIGGSETNIDSKKRLEYIGHLDLDESLLGSIMENLGCDNANEIVRQIEKIGSSFTLCVEKCQQQFQAILGETQLDSQIVARVISMMIVTQRNESFSQTGASSWDSFGSLNTGNGISSANVNPNSKAALESSSLPWDGVVFTSAVKAIVPQLNWTNVITHLDHPYFNVRNKFALQLLMKILLEGFTNKTFPIGLFYRIWNVNKPGQLSLLVQIVQNPDVFNILDYEHRSVNLMCLKVPPDESIRSVAHWKCLDLVEALFRLSEFSTLTTTVYNMFRPPGPITTCPDLLLLSILQINFSMSQMRVLTLKQLVGQLLPGHANAVSILSYAWNYETNRQALRQIVLDAMAAYYSQNSDDQTRLTRILGIAHELKPNGLAELFNLQQYLFVIDLACLASRRDFLKLDKFLDDKLTEHGEPFATNLCQYLRRRCPGISNNALPTETFQIMFTALQTKANFSPSITNELNQLMLTIRNAQIKINESRINNTGVRTPLNLPLQQSQSQLISGINSPSTANPIGSGFGGAPGTYPNLATNFINAAVSKAISGGDARLGGRTPINISQQQSGATVAGVLGNLNNPASGGFSMFQRDQSMRGARPASGMGNPFEFRAQFFGSQMAGVAGATSTSNGANRTNDFSDNLENTTFTEEVQEEANSCFQQIYSPSGRLSVHEFITRLKGFRDSIIPKDKELLMCVVKNLFDEYKFFQDYPSRELRTTAEVYGGLIREGIISNLQFATAVRKVVEAVQSDPEKPLWGFGVVSLNACRSVLFKYPKVCQMIVTNDSFIRFPSPLKEYITSGSQGILPSSQVANRESILWNPQQPNNILGTNISITQSSNINTSAAVPMPTAANVSNMKFAPRGLSAGGTSILNVTNVDTLINATEREGTSVKQPPLAIYERVSFLCNNLSQTNLPRKTEEMQQIIQESGDDFLQWLAQYLVMKRVTVEQNFQPLYNNFLITIDEEVLNEYVEKETFRNVDILLRSDKRQAVANFGDRQLLKNLGHWLGVITIGRDKPILAKDLDLKFLLLEAFYKGQQELLYVVPFVVKTLLASSKSTIFGPRCAWIYGIIKVLVEIHNEPDLKLNLKFEIEVVCKDLNIDLRTVEVGSYLKESSRLPKLVPIKQDGPSPIPHHQLRLGNSSLLLPSDDSTTTEYPQSNTGYTLSADSNHSSNVAVTSASSTLNTNEKISTGINTTAAILQGAAVAAQRQAISQPLQEIKTLGSQIHQSSLQQPQAPAVFHYNDINIYSQEGLSQHLKDPSHLALFQHNPHLKVLCKTAIVHAIKELIGGITDRSINVAITATEHVCRKDFALDPVEEHMRRAAHQMMRAMTAGMAAITCREPLATTILGYLKQALYNHLGHSSANNPDQAKMVEEAAFAVTEANLEVATNFIVKSACEKAVAEVEKRLESEFSTRRSARRDNRLFRPLDNEIVAMCEKVPESIRVKPGLINDQAIKIYDDFSSKICGFKPLAPQDLINEFAARRGPMTPNNNNLSFINNGNAIGQNSGFSFFPNAQDGIRSDSSTLPGCISQIGPPAGFNERAQQHIIQYNQIMNKNSTATKDDAETIFKHKVEIIFREWLQVYYTPVAQREPQQALGILIKLLQQYGVFATDEMITKFFRLCIDMCLEVTYCYLKNDQHQMNVRQKCYYTLDGFVKMTCLMVKHSEGNSQQSSKVNLLKKVLGTLTSALHADHEHKKQDFNGMPFHRILITMFNELTASDPVLEPISWNILESFGQALFVLQPRREPGFAFNWLDIIGHRNFIGRLLSESSDTTKTGAMYTQLILCHLKFLAPFLRNVQLPKSIAYIYKGTLRVLLVILHDFPEILCEYHYVLCDVIPANCVQLRNLVLSAYPREMCLPDPFTKSMEAIESLSEMSTNPKMHREMSTIIPSDLRTRLDDYLATRSSVNFLSDLPGLLQVSQVNGSKYNVSVVNAIVMYVGVRAIDSIHDRSERISIETIAHTAFMDIFQNLAVSLCTEGRYLLFNAISNQLRYPNSHTHYFSCTLLYLFLEANTEIIQEQITRILFERLVALRPHPWGLLITFIELIRNRRYDFWRHEFVRCAPEIERVASSCSVQQNLPEDQQLKNNPSQQLNGITVNE